MERKMASFRVENLRVSLIFIITMIGACSGELRLLQSVFRHGDRYPLPYRVTKGFYPRNPYANDTYPGDYGSLTPEGEKRSYDLGLLLLKTYNGWFGQQFSKENVKFFSSSINRYVMTASLMASALFDSKNGSVMWDSSLERRYTGVINKTHLNILLYWGADVCAKYLDLLNETKATDCKIIEYDTTMADIYDKVSSLIGAPVTNRILSYLHKNFESLNSSRLPPPAWAKELHSKGVFKDAAKYEYQFLSWNDQLKRMTGGVWLKRWLEHVDDNINRKTGKKKEAFFYSGQDVNVAGIMNALGIYYPHVPYYASAINLELHEDEETQQFYVKVVYRDSGEFSEFVIPGCDVVLCPLETFKNIISNVLVDNPNEECGPLAPAWIV